MENITGYKVTHTEEYVLENTKLNIDFIPTFEEYRLLVDKGYTQQDTFNLGIKPLYVLNISEDADKERIAEIETTIQDCSIDGLNDMLHMLLESNTTDSYEEYKIYYLAYLLSLNDIKVWIKGQEYRDKFFLKVKTITQYEEELKKMKSLPKSLKRKREIGES